jgi:hypothetical protein
MANIVFGEDSDIFPISHIAPSWIVVIVDIVFGEGSDMVGA